MEANKMTTELGNFLEQDYDVLDLNDKINEEREKGPVHISISRNVKAKVINQFVIMFYQSFLEIISDDIITKQDIKVLLKILEQMEYGNLIKYSQESIAKDLGTQQASISRSIKNLRAAGILIKTDDKKEYINPQIINKGTLRKQKSSEIYNKITTENNKNY